MALKTVPAMALLVAAASATPWSDVTTSDHVEPEAPLLRGSAGVAQVQPASAKTLQDVAKNASHLDTGSGNVTAAHYGCAAACSLQGYPWSHCWDSMCRCSQQYWETPYTCASGEASCSATCTSAGYWWWHCVAGTGWFDRSCECTNGYYETGMSCY